MLVEHESNYGIMDYGITKIYRNGCICYCGNLVQMTRNQVSLDNICPAKSPMTS